MARTLKPVMRVNGRVVHVDELGINSNPMNWGNRFAIWLGRRGITPHNYRRLKVRWGLSDACNCAERKETLNCIERLVYNVRKRLTSQATPPAQTEDKEPAPPDLG